jgi:hypothetical protein
MSRFSLFALWGGLLVGVPAYADKVIVDGQPPLTLELIAKEHAFFEWVFDTQLTEDQSHKLEDYLVSAWNNKEAKAMRGALDNLRNYDDMLKMSPDERGDIRAQVQPQLIKEFRRDKDPMSKWALEVYENARQPLVAGKPPLTRQVTDAYAELAVFVIHQVVGGEAYTADQAFRDSLAKALVPAWKKLKPADKAMVDKAPLLWAATRITWPTLSEADKTKQKKEWSEAIAGWAPAKAAATKGSTADGGQADAKGGGHDASAASTYAQNVLAPAHALNVNLLIRLSGTGWRYEAKTQ